MGPCHQVTLKPVSKKDWQILVCIRMWASIMYSSMKFTEFQIKSAELLPCPN